MSQKLRLLTSCDAPDCVALSTQEWDACVVRMPELTTYSGSKNMIMLPDGWTGYDGMTFCPRHKTDIVINVDGKPLNV